MDELAVELFQRMLVKPLKVGISFIDQVISLKFQIVRIHKISQIPLSNFMSQFNNLTNVCSFQMVAYCHLRLLNF